MTYLRGAGSDSGSGIAVDGGGNVHISGQTTSAAFPGLPPAPGLPNGGKDAFISKINAAGTAVVYTTYIGGSAGIYESAIGIAVDASGNAYVTGLTDSADFPTTAGAYDRTFHGPVGDPIDAFVTKLNATGDGLVYSPYVGGIYEPISCRI